MIRHYIKFETEIIIEVKNEEEFDINDLINELDNKINFHKYGVSLIEGRITDYEITNSEIITTNY